MFFGHEFPDGEFIAADCIALAELVGPDGAVRVLETGGRVPFVSPPLNDSGAWVVGIEQVRGYWTQTPEAGRPFPRPDLDDAVHCSYSGNAAKTLVRVGGETGEAFAQAPGNRLEILPQRDPTRLAAGDRLSIEVRFDGRPYAGSVMAFHADSGEEPYLTVESDAHGRADLPLAGPGPWIVATQAERPYPDREVCHVESFHASLAFGGDSGRASARRRARAWGAPSRSCCGRCRHRRVLTGWTTASRYSMRPS